MSCMYGFRMRLIFKRSKFFHGSPINLGWHCVNETTKRAREKIIIKPNL